MNAADADVGERGQHVKGTGMTREEVSVSTSERCTGTTDSGMRGLSGKWIKRCSRIAMNEGCKHVFVARWELAGSLTAIRCRLLLLLVVVVVMDGRQARRRGRENGVRDAD